MTALMADDLADGVQQSIHLLQGGVDTADGQAAITLIGDLQRRLAGTEHAELADTLDDLQRALSSGSEAATIGGHMSTLGGQLEAVATRAGGTGKELRDLAELLKGEGSRIAG